MNLIIRQDQWIDLRTLNDVINFINNNPLFKEFLDKPITIHMNCDGCGEGIWNNSPQIRFSFDHDELVIE